MHTLQSTRTSPAVMRRACLAGPGRCWGGMGKEIEMKEKTDRTRVLAYVRARAGERLFTEDVAVALGLTQQFVLKTVKNNSQHAANFHWDSITHSFASTGAMYRVWYGPSAQDNASDLCKRIVKVMQRPPIRQTKAASSQVLTAAALSKKLNVPAKTVAAELEAMRERGEVVRCELVLRKGYDRWEYRLMGVA